jgi:GTPase SAR1 family protein
MALNNSGIGQEIAIIKNNPKYKKTKFFVSDTEDKKINGFESFHLDDGVFQYVSDEDRDRDTIYICGSAGSGKSYWTGEYCKEYYKRNKNNPIYLISEGSADPALDDLKNLQRVKVDDSLIEDPIEWTEFENCLVIADDIDAYTGKLKKYIYGLIDKLLKNARKNKVSVIMTSHSCTGLELKGILNEANVIVFFPKNWNRSLKYLLESYVGLNKEAVKKLFKHKSRWCAFVKSFPNVIIQEKNIQTIGQLQDF